MLLSGIRLGSWTPTGAHTAERTNEKRMGHQSLRVTCSKLQKHSQKIQGWLLRSRLTVKMSFFAVSQTSPHEGYTVSIVGCWMRFYNGHTCWWPSCCSCCGIAGFMLSVLTLARSKLSNERFTKYLNAEAGPIDECQWIEADVTRRCQVHLVLHHGRQIGIPCELLCWRRERH